MFPWQMIFLPCRRDTPLLLVLLSHLISVMRGCPSLLACLRGRPSPSACNPPSGNVNRPAWARCQGLSGSIRSGNLFAFERPVNAARVSDASRGAAFRPRLLSSLNGWHSLRGTIRSAISAKITLPYRRIGWLFVNEDSLWVARFKSCWLAERGWFPVAFHFISLTSTSGGRNVVYTNCFLCLFVNECITVSLTEFWPYVYFPFKLILWHTARYILIFAICLNRKCFL